MGNWPRCSAHPTALPESQPGHLDTCDWGCPYVCLVCRGATLVNSASDAVGLGKPALGAVPTCVVLNDAGWASPSCSPLRSFEGGGFDATTALKRWTLLDLIEGMTHLLVTAEKVKESAQ